MEIVTIIIYFLADVLLWKCFWLFYTNKLIWVRENPKFAFIL